MGDDLRKRTGLRTRWHFIALGLRPCRVCQRSGLVPFQLEWAAGMQDSTASLGKCAKQDPGDVRSVQQLSIFLRFIWIAVEGYDC